MVVHDENFERDVIEARIDGLLCRAYDEGISKGKWNMILLFLESMSPEEVSRRLQMPLEDVFEIVAFIWWLF